MPAYNHTLSIRLPADLLPIAQSISKALDPDAAGEKSFQREIIGYEGETPIYADTIYASTPCTAEFHAQATAMLADAVLLHMAVSQDYATRWPDLTAPTLSECEQFLAAVIPDMGIPITEILP